MHKFLLVYIFIILFSFSFLGQTNKDKSFIIKNKLEDNHFKLPKVISTKQSNVSQVYTLPFLQLDSSILQSINADSSLYTDFQKKEFNYDNNGNINEEINSDWDQINNLWLNTTKKLHSYFSIDSLRSEENYEWNNITLTWLPKNKHLYSYALNGNLDSNLFYTWDSVSLAWRGSNADIFVYDSNNNLTNYARDRWDTITNTWIHEFKHEYSYNVGNYRTESINYTWDTVTDQWVNGYKVANTYDLIPNLKMINGYVWDSNLSQWKDDQKIGLTYDVNNNQTSDTSYTWNIGTSSWSQTELHIYSYDINNHLTENLYSSWNTGSSLWIPQDKYEYTYDLSGNKTNEIYSDWNNTAWEMIFKTSFFNYINSVATETANYTWDGNVSQWIPQDENKQHHNLSVFYADIILPFYYQEEMFHHQLNTTETYDWNTVSSSWNKNGLNTYYYSNTAIGFNELNNSTTATAFPNPTTDVVNFKLPKEEVNYTIDVFNCAGAKLLSLKNVNKINASDLNAGLYIFTITSKNNVYKGKFIKE